MGIHPTRDKTTIHQVILSSEEVEEVVTKTEAHRAIIIRKMGTEIVMSTKITVLHVIMTKTFKHAKKKNSFHFKKTFMLSLMKSRTELRKRTRSTLLKNSSSLQVKTVQDRFKHLRSQAYHHISRNNSNNLASQPQQLFRVKRGQLLYPVEILLELLKQVVAKLCLSLCQQLSMLWLNQPSNEVMDQLFWLWHQQENFVCKLNRRPRNLPMFVSWVHLLFMEVCQSINKHLNWAKVLKYWLLVLEDFLTFLNLEPLT